MTSLFIAGVFLKCIALLFIAGVFARCTTRQIAYIRQRSRGSVMLNRHRQKLESEAHRATFQRISDAARRVAVLYQIQAPLVLINNEVAWFAAIQHSPLFSRPILGFGKEVNEFTDQELEGLIGHELGHFKRRRRFIPLLHYILGIRFSREEYAADAIASTYVGTASIVSCLQRIRAVVEREGFAAAVGEIDKRLSRFRAANTVKTC